MHGEHKRKASKKSGEELSISAPRGGEQGIWRGAVEDLRFGLSAHVRAWESDKLRFQDGRLEFALWERIKAAAGKDRAERIAMTVRAYSLITTSSKGYGEPRRLHNEEMRAMGVQGTPRSFCATFGERYKREPELAAEELWFRVESITSWMEVQESFSQWIALNEDRDYWRGDPGKRAKRFQARILASWREYLGMYEYEHDGRRVRGMRVWEGLGIGTDEAGVPWSPREWSNILDQASRIAESGSFECTPLEKWGWWTYPVFSRYGWSVHEVQEAACARFTDVVSRGVTEKSEAKFRRYWITRGLRFAGQKTNRPPPPLAEFVRDIAVPALSTVYGAMA